MRDAGIQWRVQGMTKNKRKILRVLIAVGVAYLLAFCLSWGLGEIDYSRVDRGKSAIFCISLGIIQDGGTEEYIGFGYRLTAHKQLRTSPRADGGTQVCVGPEITYTARWLWPGLNALKRDKKNTRLDTIAPANQ